MEIIMMPVGESASLDTDCIRIQELPTGEFALTGTVLDADADEVVNLFAGEHYESYDAAESAGLAWANDYQVRTLHVCRSKGTAPLPEVDD